jgi:hypothetical protein
MCFSSPSPKTPQYVTTSTGQTQETTDTNTAEARRRRQSAAGQDSTIKTSSQGDTSAASTGKKALLGS